MGSKSDWEIMRQCADLLAQFGVKEIQGAQKLLKEIGGFLGPFGKCLVDGKWSLAQLETPLDFGAGNVPFFENFAHDVLFPAFGDNQHALLRFA